MNKEGYWIFEDGFYYESEEDRKCLGMYSVIHRVRTSAEMYKKIADRRSPEAKYIYHPKSDQQFTVIKGVKIKI